MIEHWQIPEDIRNEYLELIKKFIQNDELFDNFKQNPTIKLIIENTNFESGLECLSKIKSADFKLLRSLNIYSQSIIELISEREKIGNPETFDYPITSRVNENPAYDYPLRLSPTTLRYIMHVSQIIDWFGPVEFDDAVIGEIGGGYGGLCTIFHEYYSPSVYYLFDLPEVMDFQKKYIKKFNPSINVRRCKNMKLNLTTDLLLVYCSWPEFDLSTKMDYLNHVIKYAKKAILAINYDFEENLSLLKESLPGRDINVRVPGFIVTIE
jgi:putative sugar O-methyltransferase